MQVHRRSSFPLPQVGQEVIFRTIYNDQYIGWFDGHNFCSPDVHTSVDRGGGTVTYSAEPPDRVTAWVLATEVPLE